MRGGHCQFSKCFFFPFSLARVKEIDFSKFSRFRFSGTLTLKSVYNLEFQPGLVIQLGIPVLIGFVVTKIRLALIPVADHNGRRGNLMNKSLT